MFYELLLLIKYPVDKQGKSMCTGGLRATCKKHQCCHYVVVVQAPGGGFIDPAYNVIAGDNSSKA